MDDAEDEDEQEVIEVDAAVQDESLKVGQGNAQPGFMRSMSNATSQLDSLDLLCFLLCRLRTLVCPQRLLLRCTSVALPHCSQSRRWDTHSTVAYTVNHVC
jgi:hypothetical protein